MQPRAAQLLTRLGVHGPHVHFEGAHQGAAAQQVLGVNHLPGGSTSQQSGRAGLRLPGVGWGQQIVAPPQLFWGPKPLRETGSVWQGKAGSLRLTVSVPCPHLLLLAARYR